MVAVTGATGHIGNVLVRKLVALGEKVRAVLLPGENTSSLEGLPLEYVTADVRDLHALEKAFLHVEKVFHLAGVISIAPGKKHLLEEVNIGGTANVVNACLETGVNRLIYTSSIHAFADTPHGVIIDEHTLISPGKAFGDYGKSKAWATLRVFDGVKQGLDAVVVCPTGIIGPYDYRPSRTGNMLVSFAKGKLRAFPGRASYDFVDVRDVAEGQIAASLKGRKGEAYILGGQQVSVKRLFEMAAEAVGIIRAKLAHVPAWMCKIGGFFAPLYYQMTGQDPLFTLESIQILLSNSHVSCAKAETELGYIHRPMSDTVKDTLDWFKDRKLL